MNEIERFYNWLEYSYSVEELTDTLVVEISTDFIAADVYLKLNGHRWEIDEICIDDDYTLNLEALDSLYTVIGFLRNDVEYHNKNYDWDNNIMDYKFKGVDMLNQTE